MWPGILLLILWLWSVLTKEQRLNWDWKNVFISSFLLSSLKKGVILDSALIIDPAFLLRSFICSSEHVKRGWWPPNSFSRMAEAFELNWRLWQLSSSWLAKLEIQEHQFPFSWLSENHIKIIFKVSLSDLTKTFSLSDCNWTRT